MKTLLWLLLKAAIFFLLFAFALGNRHEALLYFLPDQALAVPMVVVVLGSFALGAFFGILVMLPRWWQLRRAVQQVKQAPASAAEPTGMPQQHIPRYPAELGQRMTDAAITPPYES
ncbi:MAG: LapA family protein [Brachymonas sp.]|nr:LapA family protein [Brachymonas sp.]